MEKETIMTGTSSASLSKIVNVSSIPQRSPFRYPGGKTWLIPLVRKWLGLLSNTPATFIEPFAGGAVVGLTVAFEKLADKVVLVELDPDVASVWETIINGEGRDLAESIVNFNFNAKTVDSVLASKPQSALDQAFQTVLRNRVQHGGIMAPGASLMKEGENGKGLSSRWYPATLARRILDILQVRDRIEFREGDGLAFLATNKVRKNSVFFIDPPYTVTGRRLYRHSVLDHAKLFEMLAEIKCEFLMTYDKSAEIEELAKANNFDYENVSMQGRLNLKKTELLIGRDLAWARSVATSLPFS